MTENKPIMIDGVDVSRCSYYFKHTKVCLVKMHANGRYYSCNEWCNCDFKKLSEQLTRKTQECEAQKHQVEVFTRQLETVNKEVITEKEKNATERQKREQAEQKLEKIHKLLTTCKENYGKPCSECEYSEQCEKEDTDTQILQIIDEVK